MKTLKKIKLNEFSKVELERRKMNVLKGGDGCSCSEWWATSALKVTSVMST